MVKRSRSIIVAGAGVAGLTSALCLAKAGFRVSILERSAGIEAFGAGLQISPNAFHILSGLGLQKQLKALATAPDCIRLIKAATGREITRVPLGETVVARYGLPYLVIHRADLCQVLATACNDHPDIDLRFGHRVVDAVPHANGITVMSHHNDKMHEFLGRALIAADGVWSKFRTEYIEAKPPVYSGFMAWRALVPAEQAGAKRLEHTQLWLSPDAHGVTYGVRRYNYLNMVVVVKELASEQKWNLPADIKQLQNRLSGWHSDFTDLLQIKTRWTKWPLYEAPASKHWAIDNLALVGDAAHAMLPFAAQGAAMAIEDAWVLADKLGSIDDTSDALKAYEAARMPRAMRAVRLARENSRIYHGSGPMAAMRDSVLKIMSPKMLLGRQDWLYGWRG
ncbi:MAG: FAD-dependent monooxygenase [Rhizobiaceae bacterium]|nr:FAD-dependent monooxygenase [Rhizobiaceae bacterium]